MRLMPPVSILSLSLAFLPSLYAQAATFYNPFGSAGAEIVKTADPEMKTWCWWS